MEVVVALSIHENKNAVWTKDAADHLVKYAQEYNFAATPQQVQAELA